MGTWVLILAAGDGRRLHGISRDRLGRPAPKQFSDFGSGRTLLGRTLDRALQLAPLEQVVSVVARDHEAWWREELASLPMDNIVVQPENRGTAAGILLPLLHISRRDPDAVVIVLPSDHHIEDEPTIRRSVREALSGVRTTPEGIVLLGITPDAPDTEYGWVLPAPGMRDGAWSVRTFVEKPGPLEAMRLLHGGALLNSFIFVGSIETLLDLFRQRTPRLLSSLRDGVSAGALDSNRAASPAATWLTELYRTLDTLDFSREVLQALPDRLRVLPVPSCGWSDLGTPERLARVLSGHPEALAAGHGYSAA